MGTNRKLPFGYKMEYGRVVTDPIAIDMLLFSHER